MRVFVQVKSFARIESDCVFRFGLLFLINVIRTGLLAGVWTGSVGWWRQLIAESMSFSGYFNFKNIPFRITLPFKDQKLPDMVRILSPNKLSQLLWYSNAFGWPVCQLFWSIHPCLDHNISHMYLDLNGVYESSLTCKEHTVGHQMTKDWDKLLV